MPAQTQAQKMHRDTRPQSADPAAGNELAGAALLEVAPAAEQEQVAQVNSAAIPTEQAAVDLARAKLIAAEKHAGDVTDAINSLASAGIKEDNPAVVLLIQQQKDAEAAAEAAKARLVSAEKSLGNAQRTAPTRSCMSARSLRRIAQPSEHVAGAVAVASVGMHA